MGPLLTVLSHLCISLTLDLELQKRCPMDGNISHIFPRSMPSQFQGKVRIPGQRNIEHRRTALACYFLTSRFVLYFVSSWIWTNRRSTSASSFHSRVESLSWSPYLEECLKVLENSKEAPGDSLLVHFVKVQSIINLVIVCGNDVVIWLSTDSGILSSHLFSDCQAGFADA